MKHQTYDKDGNLISEETVVVPPEVLNAEYLVDAAKAALTSNRAFAQLTNPSTAQLSAQVKALTRQNQYLIRLVLNLLDDTD